MLTSTSKFQVLGDLIEVLTSGEETGGRLCALRQTCRPGSGPPPHWHENEDELFMVVEGRFELFDGTIWTELPKGQTAFALRGQVHTFRNCGDAEGTIIVVATPGKFDEYLRAISGIQMPQDAGRLIEISVAYGIHFVQ